MTFYRGQKVAFVGWPKDSTWWESMSRTWFRFWHPYRDPSLNEIYTVAAIQKDDDGIWLELVEYDDGDPDYWAPGWDSRGFRPVVERKTDISIFTKILDDVKTNRDRVLEDIARGS